MIRVDSDQPDRGNDGVASLAFHRRIGRLRHVIISYLQYGGEISEALIMRAAMTEPSNFSPSVGFLKGTGTAAVQANKYRCVLR